jgi:hypothetical protein
MALFVTLSLTFFGGTLGSQGSALAKGGSAADLGGPVSVGLLPCKDLVEDPTPTIEDLVDQVMASCEKDNRIRKQKGQVSCPVNTCLSQVKKGVSKPNSNVQVRIGFNSLDSSVFFSVQYVTEFGGSKGSQRLDCQSRPELQFEIRRQVVRKTQESLPWACWQ